MNKKNKRHDKPTLKKRLGKQDLVSKAKKTAHKTIRVLVKTSLPEIAFVSSLIFGKYLINADFQYPSELIIPIVFFAVAGT